MSEEKEGMKKDAIGWIESYLTDIGNEMFSRIEIANYIRAGGAEPNQTALADAIKQMSDEGRIAKVESVPYYCTHEKLEDLEAKKKAERKERHVITYKVDRETLNDFEKEVPEHRLVEEK